MKKYLAQYSYKATQMGPFVPSRYDGKDELTFEATNDKAAVYRAMELKRDIAVNKYDPKIKLEHLLEIREIPLPKKS